PWMRRAFAGTVLPQPLHQPVDRGRELGASAARRLRESLQLPAERGVHAANALERFFKAFPWCVRRHGFAHAEIITSTVILPPSPMALKRAPALPGDRR